MTEIEAAYTKLVQENHGSIYRICRAYLPAREDAEDLYQEIVYQLWISMASFKGDSKVSTWVYRVAVNTAIQYKTKLRRQVNVDVLVDIQPN